MTLLALSLIEFRLPENHTAIKLLETALGIGAIWVSVSMVRVLFFTTEDDTSWRARVPGLLVDLIRFAVIAVGAFLVIGYVWESNLSGALATLGVGSLVIGLALQETLGNLFAGISLVFERPFQVGEWIKVGEIEGQVINLNWRSVYIQPRSLDMVVVPNSVLARERITNFSRSTQVHGFDLDLSFSYDDPPNKVKRVLNECARRTKDILPMGISIRMTGFGESAITYKPRVFTERYDRLPEIREEFYTHVWYAARRHGLTIPYPIRTVLKTEMPQYKSETQTEIIRQQIARLPIFASLEPREINELAEDAIIEEYGSGELVFSQGEGGDSMHIILSGRVEVVIAGDNGSKTVLAKLGPGDYFGEIALLTGEVRTAGVIASEDLKLITIYKEALAPILQSRPELAVQLAEVVEQRRSGLKEAKDSVTSGSALQRIIPKEGSQIVERIRGFFGLGK